MNTPRHTLYHYSWCGYCRRVRQVADDLGIELNLVDLDEHREARDYLISKRNRTTVPVLGIPTPQGEKLLGESREIVKYLTQNAQALTAA